MGGHALKNTFTRRCDREEYDRLVGELTPIFEKKFARVGFPLFYKSKETFGDIDILVEVTENDNVYEYIKETFSPNEIFSNGNCYSFDYKEIQVDVITTIGAHYASNLMYLSYNDLGNMIGRLAHPFGLKYGQEGLWYEYYDLSGHNLGKIPVSKDFRKIYDFLQLDYSRWEQGFDKLEDIFEFVASSIYFDWRQYQMETLNHINRERNLKRKSYMSLLDWIETNGKKQEYEFKPNKNDYVNFIDDNFPEANLPTEIRRLEYEKAKKLYIQSKFNGTKISRKFGLFGPELGKAIVGYKKFVKDSYGIPSEHFDEWIFVGDEDFLWKSFKIYLSY